MVFLRLDQVLHLARLLVHLGEHETVKLGLHALHLKSARHTRGQLVTITQEGVPDKRVQWGVW
jgi:hypothetical protein